MAATETPEYHARLSPDGSPQVEHGERAETYVPQRTEQLSAMDAIVRAACWAVADEQPAARILYDKVLEPIVAIFLGQELAADPAQAGLRKTYELAARRVQLSLLQAGDN